MLCSRDTFGGGGCKWWLWRSEGNQKSINGHNNNNNDDDDEDDDKKVNGEANDVAGTESRTHQLILSSSRSLTLSDPTASPRPAMTLHRSTRSLRPPYPPFGCQPRQCSGSGWPCPPNNPHSPAPSELFAPQSTHTWIAVFLALSTISNQIKLNLIVVAQMTTINQYSHACLSSGEMALGATGTTFNWSSLSRCCLISFNASSFLRIDIFGMVVSFFSYPRVSSSSDACCTLLSELQSASRISVSSALGKILFRYLESDRLKSQLVA